MTLARTRWARAALPTAMAAAIVIVRVCGGCDDSGPQGQDAAPDARADHKVLPDAIADSDSAGVPCAVAGYALDDSYDANCGFCYPTSPAALPPPITWKSCDGSVTPPGMMCSLMVEDWDFGTFFSYISGQVPAWVQPDQTVTFMIGRMQWPYIYRMVVDADGPVRQVILESNAVPGTQRCTIGLDSIRDGYAAYRIYDSETSSTMELGGGGMGGDMNAVRPRVYAHYHNDHFSRDYYASALGLFEISTNGSTITEYDWNSGDAIQVIDSAAMNNNWGIGYVWPTSTAIFNDSNYGMLSEVRVWTPDGGARDFISYGNDWTHSGGDFGSDGTWMAWSVGDGRPDQNSKFDKVHLLTSAYTTDANPTGQELTTVSGWGMAATPFVVGCGYAARQSIIPLDASITDANTLQIFRLSDGMRWSLPAAWTQPLAITCTELFATVAVPGDDAGVKSHYTIGRVRLDSLGVGMPAD